MCRQKSIVILAKSGAEPFQSLEAGGTKCGQPPAVPLFLRKTSGGGSLMGAASALQAEINLGLTLTLRRLFTDPLEA